MSLYDVDFPVKCVELLAMHINQECGDGDAILYVKGCKHNFEVVVSETRKRFPNHKVDERQDTFHFHDGSNENIIITMNEGEWYGSPCWVGFRLMIA